MHLPTSIGVEPAVPTEVSRTEMASIKRAVQPKLIDEAELISR